ncbi:STAS domain-containing protein [Sphingomonas sp. CV7422]|nr:STAS domain-containing protein [Sphingomonas sp. CV7422]EZP50444.1 hypothetical protein BW41_03151 [Sphingomonas sp. RIT328]
MMATNSLVFNENACLQSIGDIAGPLLESIDAHADTVIDLSQATRIDLSILQLLVSARRHADQIGHDLRLAQPADARLTTLLDAAGFLTAIVPADATFWFHGDLPQ